MATTTRTIKQNDTRPKLVVTLLENYGEVDEAPIDLTTATSVKFLMRAQDAPPSDPPKVDAAAAITTAASGLVTYTWDAADTDEAGVFEAEFEITWGDGGVETVPNGSYFTVEVVDDLG